MVGMSTNRNVVMPPPALGPMWHVPQVAAFLGISEKAVRQMIRAGRLRGAVQPGGKIYMVPDATIRALASADSGSEQPTNPD